MTPVSKMFSPQFFKESLSNVCVVVFGIVIFSPVFFSQFRSWLDDRAFF
jgi:hypothetical protein